MCYRFKTPFLQTDIRKNYHPGNCVKNTTGDIVYIDIAYIEISTFPPFLSTPLKRYYFGRVTYVHL